MSVCRPAALVASVLLVFLLLPCLGCSPMSVFEEPQDRRFIMVLVDFSRSTLPKDGEPDPYAAVLEEVLGQVQGGDHLVVGRITENSMSGFHPAVNQRVPTYNGWLEAKARFDKQLKEIKTALRKNVEGLLQARKAKLSVKTDVMSSLILAGNYFAGAPPEASKFLLVLSDMLEDSEQYNFERTRLTAKETSRILLAEKASKRIPQLKGVTVMVSGVTGKSSRQMMEVKEFWFRYFREAGAEISDSEYMPVLANIRFGS